MFISNDRYTHVDYSMYWIAHHPMNSHLPLLPKNRAMCLAGKWTARPKSPMRSVYEILDLCLQYRSLSKPCSQIWCYWVSMSYLSLYTCYQLLSCFEIFVFTLRYILEDTCEEQSLISFYRELNSCVRFYYESQVIHCFDCLFF